MLNPTLFKREIKGSLKLLLFFAAVLTLYIMMIIGMYDPKLMASLDNFVRLMPRLMASVGMKAGAANLETFIISYLYGFLLILFPMAFSILRANALIARYVDNGSMVSLTAAPVKRRTVARTQCLVLLCSLTLLLTYVTILEYLTAIRDFPGELGFFALLKLNFGLLCLHIFIAGISFLASCLFNETKLSLAFGAGIPSLMFVFQMLVNATEDAAFLKYFTAFSLYAPSSIAAGESGAFVGIWILLAAALFLYVLAIEIFNRKDLPI